jgi:hypothetical protein
MEKSNDYITKAACGAMLLLLLAFINVGHAVGASPPSNVNVLNTPLPVHEVANPASQPFQAYVSFSIASGSTSSGPIVLLGVVPPGKRLVIEYVTMLGESGSGKMAAWISTTVAGVSAQHYLVLTEQGPLYGVPAFAASQPMRVYADPGTEVTGFVIRSDTTGTADGNISVSGYLVDVP